MENESSNLIYIGLDDTDALDSSGAGRLARALAKHLMSDFPISGVTR